MKNSTLSFMLNGIFFFLLTLSIPSDFLFAQGTNCNDAIVLDIGPNWQEVGPIHPYPNSTYYKFTPTSNGTLQICMKAWGFGILDDCPSSNYLDTDELGICGDHISGGFAYLHEVELQLGTTYYFECSTIPDYSGPVDVKFLPDGDDCLHLQEVELDREYVFNTREYSNSYGGYECNANVYQGYNGQERFFHLNLSTPTDITIQLESNKFDRDILSVYRECVDCLSGCILFDCQGISQDSSKGEQIIIDNAIGEYIIVTDWSSQDSMDLEEGNEIFFIVRTAPFQSGNNCKSPDKIACGEQVEFSHNQISNTVSKYKCNPSGITEDAKGHDRFYILNVPTPQDVSINLFSTKPDADVLGVYELCPGCDPCDIPNLPCMNLSATNASQETTVIPAAQGTYLIACDWQPADMFDFAEGITFTLTIDCDPCSVDTIPPIVECPSDITVQADPGANCAVVNYPPATASDNCALDNITYSPPAGYCFPLGMTTVEVIATDESGNTSTCAFKVTVEETLTFCDSAAIKCGDSIDILFLIDNSSSMTDNNFNAVTNIVQNSITQIENSFSNTRYGVVHYGGNNGNEVYIEHDFTTASSASNINRQFYGGDDLNESLRVLLDAINSVPNPKIQSSTKTLSLSPNSKFYIVLFTDAGDYSSSPNVGNGSSLTPFEMRNELIYDFNASFSVVYFDPWAGTSITYRDRAAAVASVGGNYYGPIWHDPLLTNPDPTSLPRQFTLANYNSPDVNLIPNLPFCDTSFTCNNLDVLLTDENSDSCCYTIDLSNNLSDDVGWVQAELISDGWIFNTSKLQLDADLQWACTPTSKWFCISAQDGLPMDYYDEAVQYCFATNDSMPSATQEVVFTWYCKDSTVLCKDTLTTNCDPGFDDPCVDFEVVDLQCNPDNPNEYFLTFNVTNNSNYDVNEVLLNGIQPTDFGFSFCNLSAYTSFISISLGGPLAPGNTSSDLCVKIYSVEPILSPEEVCFNVGIEGPEFCCHSPDEACITVESCCNICEEKGVVYEEMMLDTPRCCYTLDIVDSCGYDIFTKIETEILSPGIEFGYHAIGGPNAGDWQTLSSTPYSIVWAPISGTIPQGTTEDIIQFCLDQSDPIVSNPQEVLLKWYVEGADGKDSVACTDLLTFDCIPEYECVAVSNRNFVCVPEEEKYEYTFKITNTSSIPFSADMVDLSIVQPATGFQIPPSGGSFNLPSPFNPGDMHTITADIISLGSFPPLVNEIVVRYRLRYQTGDTCCYESVLDTLPLPPCSDCTCEGFGDFTFGDPDSMWSDIQGIQCGDLVSLPNCVYEFEVDGSFMCSSDTCDSYFEWRFEKIGGDCVDTCLNSSGGSDIDIDFDCTPEGDNPKAEGPGQYILTITGYCGDLSSPCVCEIMIDVSCDTAACIDVSLIDSSAICPHVYEPVCGCDGVTYSNECYAIHFGGVTQWTNGPCDQACCLDMTYESNDPFNSRSPFNHYYNFIDIDNDGDRDFMISGTEYYENLGSASAPYFDVPNKSNIIYTGSITSDVFYTYDYNTDGFEDIFLVDQNYDLLYLENQGIAGTPSYDVYNTGVSMPFHGGDVSYNITIGDLSNDGLPDLVVGFQYPLYVVYYEHINGANCSAGGTPCFQLANNSYGNPYIEDNLNGVEFPVPEIYDGDCDGDNDLYIGLAGEIRLYKNNGAVVAQGSTPDLDLSNPISNPHGISNVNTSTEWVTPRFVDIEYDFDVELFVADGRNMKYYENCVDTSTSVKQLISQEVKIYPNPSNGRYYLSLHDQNQRIKSVRMIDLNGREVLYRESDNGSSIVSINAPTLQAGVYITEVISDENERFVQKVLIQ